MQGWRKSSCPRVPKTIQEYVQLLNSQRWKSRFFLNDSNLDVDNIIGTDGSVATVFIDGIILQNFTNVNLYVDATYKVCPRQPNKKIYQFFTIMASFDDTVSTFSILGLLFFNTKNFRSFPWLGVLCPIKVCPVIIQ